MDAARQSVTHVDDSAEKPIVRGTDIKVSQIASEFEHLGMTPDEIVEAHPHLTLADVHAALAYYYDHQEAIRLEWRAAEKVIRALQARFPRRPAPDSSQ
jgi:uncharacterized protein (DUF433 family)